MNLFIEKLKKLFKQKYFAAAFPPVVQLKNPPPSEMLWPQRLYMSSLQLTILRFFKVTCRFQACVTVNNIFANKTLIHNVFIHFGVDRVKNALKFQMFAFTMSCCSSLVGSVALSTLLLLKLNVFTDSH